MVDLPKGAVYTPALGTVGAAMYTYTADQMRAYAAECVAAERERWAATVRRMHAADDRYGCGFYNDDEWRTAYADLRAMCGLTKM